MVFQNPPEDPRMPAVAFEGVSRGREPGGWTVNAPWDTLPGAGVVAGGSTLSTHTGFLVLLATSPD